MSNYLWNSKFSKLTSKERKNTMEYLLGRSDRTNPLNFKIKNDFYFSNSFYIINMDQKNDEYLRDSIIINNSNYRLERSNTVKKPRTITPKKPNMLGSQTPQSRKEIRSRLADYFKANRLNVPLSDLTGRNLLDHFESTRRNEKQKYLNRLNSTLNVEKSTIDTARARHGGKAAGVEFKLDESGGVIGGKGGGGSGRLAGSKFRKVELKGFDRPERLSVKSVLKATPKPSCLKEESTGKITNCKVKLLKKSRNDSCNFYKTRSSFLKINTSYKLQRRKLNILIQRKDIQEDFTRIVNTTHKAHSSEARNSTPLSPIRLDPAKQRPKTKETQNPNMTTIIKPSKKTPSNKSHKASHTTNTIQKRANPTTYKAQRSLFPPRTVKSSKTKTLQIQAPEHIDTETAVQMVIDNPQADQSKDSSDEEAKVIKPARKQTKKSLINVIQKQAIKEEAIRSIPRKKLRMRDYSTALDYKGRQFNISQILSKENKFDFFATNDPLDCKLKDFALRYNSNRKEKRRTLKLFNRFLDKTADELDDFLDRQADPFKFKSQLEHIAYPEYIQEFNAKFKLFAGRTLRFMKSQYINKFGMPRVFSKLVLKGDQGARNTDSRSRELESIMKEVKKDCSDGLSKASTQVLGNMKILKIPQEFRPLEDCYMQMERKIKRPENLLLESFHSYLAEPRRDRISWKPRLKDYDSFLKSFSLIERENKSSKNKMLKTMSKFKKESFYIDPDLCVIE